MLCPSISPIHAGRRINYLWGARSNRYRWIVFEKGDRRTAIANRWLLPLQVTCLLQAEVLMV